MANPDRRHPRHLYRDQRVLLAPVVLVPAKPVVAPPGDELDELVRAWTDDETGRELDELRPWSSPEDDPGIDPEIAEGFRSDGI